MANGILEFLIQFHLTKPDTTGRRFLPKLVAAPKRVVFICWCCSSSIVVAWCCFWGWRKTRPVQTGSEVVGQAQPAETKRVRAGGARASRGGPEPVGAAQKRVLTGGAGGASPGTHPHRRALRGPDGCAAVSNGGCKSGSRPFCVLRTFFPSSTFSSAECKLQPLSRKIFWLFPGRTCATSWPFSSMFCACLAAFS